MSLRRAILEKLYHTYIERRNSAPGKKNEREKVRKIVDLHRCLFVSQCILDSIFPKFDDVAASNRIQLNSLGAQDVPKTLSKDGILFGAKITVMQRIICLLTGEYGRLSQPPEA